MLLLALLLAAPGPAPAPAPAADLVDVLSLEPRLRLDVKYATTDNFTKKQLYPVARCLLRPEVAAKLVAAQKLLNQRSAGAVLLLKDCYRPVRVQHVMWDVVKDTPMRNYVANPFTKTGSVHNYGCAVDLSVLGADGKELDMGTPYDTLGVMSEPRHEEEFLAQGKLVASQIENRKLLRGAMVDAGFMMIRNEWWHFDAWQGDELRKRYQPLDVPLEEVR